ncbi:MAG: cobalamin B12-binding domain-containing protein [Nitrospirae bacterium]|nr:cobalamin B12-binding domain-containing protein [Nitrospirota bacterium]
MRQTNKIKVILVHPPLLNVLSAATPEYVDENRGHTPPLGLLYIQAAVEHSAHESIFLDGDLEEWDHKETAMQALSHNPGLIALQGMTFTFPDAYRVAKEIKLLNPDAKVLVGGPHPTIYPIETAKLEHIDFAFAGEGEFDFIAFLDVFRDINARTAVPGIASKNGNEVIYTPSRGLLKNLDSVYFPARKSSKYNNYTSVLAKSNPITTMITSRGCPFNCVFCNRMGRQYRFHSAGYVLDEIEDILSLGIKEIFIHDDTFTLKRERVKAICEGIIDRGYNFSWEARTRIDCVDKELISLMSKAGCHRLSFGIESGSEKVLKSMRKGIDISMVGDIFKWCMDEGIITLGDFMFGNLDEEKEDIDKTLKFVKRLRPDYVQFSICSPYPGTPLYEIGLKTGVVPGDVWLEFANNPLKPFQSPVWTQHFTKDELIKITASAYRSFYMRPSFILKQLMNIHSFNQLKTLARGAVGILRK